MNVAKLSTNWNIYNMRISGFPYRVVEGLALRYAAGRKLVAGKGSQSLVTNDNLHCPNKCV
jgi:hypothetical protein